MYIIIIAVHRLGFETDAFKQIRPKINQSDQTAISLGKLECAC